MGIIPHVAGQQSIPTRIPVTRLESNEKAVNGAQTVKEEKSAEDMEVDERTG
jgi:hypothetical protein